MISKDIISANLGNCLENTDFLELCALGLSNFSEFGLIVTYTSIKAGWLPPEWLPVIGVAVALSFLAATPVNAASHRIYERNYTGSHVRSHR